MNRPPRLLIVTAAFGEGHNSAARNLALAATDMGAEVRVADPCIEAVPAATRIVSGGYRIVTTHFPRIWARIYESTDRCDFSQPRLPLLRPPEYALERMIDDWHPDAVVSTYPLYPYFLERIFQRSGRPVPVFTVVTDSIAINASWLRAPSDWWLVTDAHTRKVLIDAGLPARRVVDTGFPVAPCFASLAPVSESDVCRPFRVLYFPTAKLPHIRRHGRALLEAGPDVTLTIVMGRNTRRLYGRARELRAQYPGRVRLIGWTRKVPALMARHHMVVGKAGGATVHEAIAARCPMLIHHLVPGQEEGNLALLKRLGCGELATGPEDLAAAVRDMTSAGAASWRAMKRALAAHNRSDGGTAAAKFILGKLAGEEVPAKP